MVVAWYVTQTAIPRPVAIEMKRYLFARQNPDDGGWGLHIEGESTAYGTTMTYVVLRLLGASEEDMRMVKARGMLHQLGGAVNGPHWAKFWLAVLGVMEWEAVNPVPPELWYIFAQETDTGRYDADSWVQASSGLDAIRSLAMVDTHANGVFAHVIHLLYEIRLPAKCFDSTDSRRGLHTALFISRLCIPEK